MIPREMILPDGTTIPLTPLQRLRLAIQARNAPGAYDANHYRTALQEIAAGKLTSKPTVEPR